MMTSAHSLKPPLQENGLHGAPDLVIEFRSPATARYDLAEKKDVYERYGVKEFWIIDPADKSVTGLVRENDQWVLKHTLVGRIDSGLLDWQLDF